MPVSTSANLGFALPGATLNDPRLIDIQAIRSALVSLDSNVSNALNNTSGGSGTSTGSSTIDFATKNLTVSGDILPSGNSLQNIGSTTNRFKAIYVDEAYLSVNTLYLGDTPVIGTEQDIINIKADLNQSINVKTTGVGNTYITSEHGVELSSTGLSGDVLVQATGAGSLVRFAANQAVNITAPSVNTYGNSTVSGDQNIAGNLTVTGSLVINGATTTVNTTTLTVTDNIIEVNKGQIGPGVSAGKAGLSVNRGDEPVYQMVFDETDDMFKVGMVGALQTIASQNFVIATAAPIAHVGTGATAHAVVSTSINGFMSAADKVKLDGIAAGANVAPVTSVAGKTGEVALTVSDIADASSINLIQNSKNVNYTCELGDAGKHIYHPPTDSTPRTFTIPSNTAVPYVLGTVLTFINHNTAGAITIAINSDTLWLAGTGQVTTCTLSPNGAATAIKISNTEWMISGNGIA